ncbi:MAG: shikimate kinase [Thaumarchaeota archaeon 13_1_20CM_2_39_20]|nr:MAG: shikimate kinase [Thaumarchaeota archaeon 13_1_40CM_2_39_13_1]OLE40094.1 MAG: shikimate kinase [Thaumarchaeota archaeon 13_1_20CM_2_39_20]
MTQVKASMHGAVSIVNAIATGKGAALGISLGIEATITTEPGKGIFFLNRESNLSARLIRAVVETSVPKSYLEQTKIGISVKTEIPSGYGLKSSSAISSVISLACAKLFKPKASDFEILGDGVHASIQSKLSITGAFDDACACYFGGFVVTDNTNTKITRSEKAPDDLSAVIFVPKSRRRGNVKRLRTLQSIFAQAWDLASKSEYWNAMILNGLATSTILGSDPRIITELIESGALGATISGNGPSIAAVAKNDRISNVKKVFSSLEGETIVSPINNKKAEVYEV